MFQWPYRLVVIIMLDHAAPQCSPERYFKVYIQHSHTPSIPSLSCNAGVQSHEIAVTGFVGLLRSMYHPVHAPCLVHMSRWVGGVGSDDLHPEGVAY